MTNNKNNIEEGLDRFKCAQDAGIPFMDSNYENALSEIRAGRKTSHWIWFVFPQLDGLGSSAMCRRFGIRGLKEARAYLEDDVLRGRLVDITEALLLHAGRKTAAEVLGDIDAAKVRSCMTLFSEAATMSGCMSSQLFDSVIDEFYGGEHDSETFRILRNDSEFSKPVQTELF